MSSGSYTIDGRALLYFPEKFSATAPGLSTSRKTYKTCQCIYRRTGDKTSARAKSDTKATEKKGEKKEEEESDETRKKRDKKFPPCSLLRLAGRE